MAVETQVQPVIAAQHKCVQTGNSLSTEDLPSAKLVPVEYDASGNFASFLDCLGISVLATTYQAGKLLTLGSFHDELKVGFSNFERAMGLAIGDGRIAVGSRSQIWFLDNEPELAKQMEPAGKHDACFLTRSSRVTGEIHGHEMSFCGEELWVVNTRFSCLSTLSHRYSFVPRWKPSFITELAPEDRCHLNGLACENGHPRYVTAFSETDTASGWRPSGSEGGCVIDVTENRVLTRGLCMPHSPRIHNDEVYLLDSGRGRLCRIDRRTGDSITITQLAGFARGLSIFGPFAFVGLSRIRETALFGDLPVREHNDALQCGVAVVDLASGNVISQFIFNSGVTEIFSVEVMPNTRCPYTVGPFRGTDEGPPIWHAPKPLQSDANDHQQDDEASENP